MAFGSFRQSFDYPQVADPTNRTMTLEVQEMVQAVQKTTLGLQEDVAGLYGSRSATKIGIFRCLHLHTSKKLIYDSA